MTQDRPALERALETITALRTALAERGPAREPIAIVGLACRFPGQAGTPEAFWSLLRDGVDAIGPFPKQRWDSADFYDPDPDHPGTAYTLDGGYVEDIEDFDPALFGISPDEAWGMDPQQRQVLEVGWEALERAGIAPDSLAGSPTGVYLGASTSDYVRLRQEYLDPDAVDGYQLLGENSFIAGRVSYTLGLRGPAEVIDTACSSSLVAVHHACRALRTGEIDLALAGGVNAILSPYGFVLLSKSRALSPGARCRSFDAAADGYARGEGCGVVVLKRLSDARAAGDEIVAVLHGSAVNHDGRSSGISVPSGQAQQAVIDEALADAGVGAEQIDYVEAHGTGTPLGDPIELRALHAAIGARRPADRPVRTGSAKTNIGHLEAAAGIVGLIKTALALSHEELPPSLHFHTPNPNVEWPDLNVEVVAELTPWRGADRYAGLSSFGASGTNAHLVLGAAPSAAVPADPDATGTVELFTLSARTEPALRALAGRYAAELSSGRLVRANQSLAMVCAGVRSGRARQRHRLATAVTGPRQLAEQLEAYASTGPNAVDRFTTVGTAIAAHRAKPVFMFPGQGAQYPGMGMELYDTQPAFRAALAECDDLLHAELDVSVIDVIRNSNSEILASTRFTQPAVFAVEYAMAKLLESLGVRPFAVIGHSVGEYAAACVAGVLDLADAARLIAVRAQFMHDLREPGAMLALDVGEQRALELIDGRTGLDLAAVNAPDAVVVSGSVAAIERLADELPTTTTARRLQVSHAFHSALVEPMLESLRTAAAGVVAHAPRIVFAANLTGELVGADPVPDADYWAAHARRPVRFAAGLEAVVRAGGSALLEVGPGRTLVALAARTVDTARVPLEATMRRGGNTTRTETRQVQAALGALHVHGCRFEEPADPSASRLRSTLPTYAFEHSTFAVSGAATSTRAEGVAASGRPSSAPRDEQLLYRVEWRPVTATAAPIATGRILLLTGADDDSAGLAAAMQQRLAADGSSCTIADAAGDLEAILAGAQPDRVVYLAALGATVPDAEDQVITLCRLLRVAAQFASRPTVWLVTRDAQRCGPADRVGGLAAAPLIGVGKVAALEQPEVWGGQLDLDRRPSAEDADAVVAAVSGGSDDDETAIRDGRRLVPRLVPSSVPDRDPAVRADATYLITGGLGGLGLTIAGWLADRGAEHLVLTGRAGLPDDSAENDTTTRHRRAAIDALRARGVEVRVEPVDVCDRDATAVLVDRIGPRLAGVIHAAGTAGPADLLTLDEEQARAVLRPKVTGAWVLHEVLGDRPLDFFVGMSSIAAVWGSAHLAAYAAANQFLDALAGFRQGRDRPGLAVDWGPWLVDSGLGGQDLLDRLTASGLRPLAPDAGVSLLGNLIASTATQAVVCGADWTVLGPLLCARSPRPLLDDLPTPAGPDAGGEPSALVSALLAARPEERLDRIGDYLLGRISAQLGVDRDELRGADVSLTELGLDSLGVLTLCSGVNRDLGLAVNARRFFEVPAPEWGDLLHAEFATTHEPPDTHPLVTEGQPT